MGAYTIPINGNIEIDLKGDYRDNGWVISGQKAIHSGCNQGKIKLKGFNYTVGVPNVFHFIISGYSSGILNLKVGAFTSANFTTNGDKYVTVTPSANDEVSFFADGNIAVELLEVYTDTLEATATTIAFDETSNRWRTYWSYSPDFMLKFKNNFFTFKNGSLWKHNSNETRNNFYGQQYKSNIIFYVNLSPTMVKDFFSMREKSNKLWEVKDAYIFPTEHKQNGQRSRLKKNRFRLMQGDWFAEFLRDMNDVRFNDELSALMNGALLQGNVMRITIENEDTVEVRLLSIDILTSSHQYTY